VRFQYAEILNPQGFKAERVHLASSKNPAVGFLKRSSTIEGLF